MTEPSKILGNPARLATLQRTGLLDSTAEEAFDRLTRLASKILGTPVTLVSLVDDKRQFFKSQVGLAEPWASQRETPLTHSFCKYVVAEGKPLLVSNASTHPLVHDNLAIRDLGVVAYAGIPLTTSDGETLGSFCAIDSQPHEWTEEEIETLRDLAASVMTEIELRIAFRNVQQEAAEAEEERRAKLALLNSTGEGIYGVDVQGCCTFINSAAAQALGYRPEEIVGKHMHPLIHHSRVGGADYPAAECPMLQAYQSGEKVHRDDEVFWRSDGTCFPVEYTASPILEDGTIAGAVISFNDITRRKMLQSRLLLQYAVSRTLAEATSVEEALTALLRSIGESLGWRVGAVWLVDADRRFLRCKATWQAPSSQSAEFEATTRRLSFARGEGLPGRVWSEQSPLWINNLQQIGHLPRAPLAAKEGLDGAVLFPIRSGSRRLGVIEFFNDHVPEPDQDLLDAVAALGNQIGQFIDRQQREEELRESEALQRAVIDTALDCIIIMDHEGLVREWNPPAEETFGYTREEALGQPLADLIVPPALREAHWRGLERYRATGEGPVLKRRLELMAIRSDGSEFPVEITITPIHLDDTPLFTGYLRDITARKQAEEEISRAKEAAEVANQAKSQFLANMSHELRTPLNSVILYSELLQEEVEDQGLDSFVPDLKKINSAGRQLLSLVNDLLDLSKIEAGKMDVYWEEFDVPAMLQDVVAIIEPLIEQNNNTLEVRCAAELGTMESDLTKVRQGLFNLLSNASKFTEGGKITLEVERQRRQREDWFVFRVTDSGIGMTEEQVAKLFQPFTQADTSTTRKYGGTGLGLTITKRFCMLLGGNVEVESEVGRGSTFSIYLPAKRMVQEQPGVDAKSGNLPHDENCVLVIDDDPAVHDLMKRFLGKEGFNVITAGGGEEGLRLARELHPDIITLDVMMSHMDGWAVLAALKADPELAGIPVIMLTIMDDKNLGYALGAAEYLTKPIDRERLFAVLNKYRSTQQDCTILVVDDDAGARKSLRTILERQGCSVIEAEHGQAALERLAEQQPSIILLDLMMPQVDGFEFADAVRQHEEWCGIPIIAVTGRDITPEERIRLSGCVEKILQKGAFTKEGLLGEIRRLMQAHKGEPEART